MNVAATVYRGDLVENTHTAHVAVVDAEGQLLYAFGNPARMTLARSAAKPAQAVAVLETGALERFGFDDADLALMCASHNSEPRHIERTRAMLAKAQVTEADLRCGGHAPLSDAVWKEWIKRDFTPTGVCSNCSGKHAGMLAGAHALGGGGVGLSLAEASAAGSGQTDRCRTLRSAGKRRAMGYRRLQSAYARISAGSAREAGYETCRWWGRGV